MTTPLFTQTSADANASVDKNQLRKSAFSALKRRPAKGFTIDELSKVTGIDRQSLSPRMTELERNGKAARILINITDSGVYRFASRPGKSGKSQQVWFPVI